VIDQKVHGDAAQKADRISGRDEGRTRTGTDEYLLGKVGCSVPANAPRKELLDPAKFLAVKGLQNLIRACVLAGRPRGQHGGFGVIPSFPDGIIGCVAHLSGMVALAHTGLRMMRARGGSVLCCAIPAPA
jgi:hypothetical protein